MRRWSRRAQTSSTCWRRLLLPEAFSNHPVAQAILEACPDHPEASEVKELAGRGISCMVEGRSVLCGNARLLKENGIEVPDESATCVHVARDGDYLGHITVRDELRDDAVQTMRRLRELGVETVTMPDRGQCPRGGPCGTGGRGGQSVCLAAARRIRFRALPTSSGRPKRAPKPPLWATASTTRRCLPWRTSEFPWAWARRPPSRLPDVVPHGGAAGRPYQRHGDFDCHAQNGA